MREPNFKTQAHTVALHPDDLHRVQVRWQGQHKTLAQLTPPECRELTVRCIGKARAAALLRGIGCWDEVARFYCFNHLMQIGKLAMVLA